jgi:thiol-disulfide isomerase/thioredoxin
MAKAKSSMKCGRSTKIAMCVLLAVAIVFGCAAFFMPQVRERFVGAAAERFMGGAPVGAEHFDTDKADAVQLVHAKWCGHCTELLKPSGVWEQLKKMLPGVSFSELDESTVEGKAAISKCDIKGFPDIRAVKSSSAGPVSIETYDGARTAKDLKAWVLKVVPPV